MEEKSPQSNGRRWMLLIVPLVLLVLLAGIAVVLAPRLTGQSNAASQKTPAVQQSSDGTTYAVLTPPPPPTCTATVKVDKVLSNGYQATVSVTNTGEQSLNTWMIYWKMPTGTKFVKGWNADVFEDGDVIMAHPTAENRLFAAGSTISVGFEATGPSDQPASEITLNGITCK